MPATGSSLAANASPGNHRPQTTARECHEETGLHVVVGRLRRTIEHHYPHGHVRLHFFDCQPVDRFAEPQPARGAAGSRPAS